MHALFPLCPICNRPGVGYAGYTGSFLRREVRRCRFCGAQYVSAGGGRYRLERCRPRAAARVRGLPGALACTACVPCLVGQAMTLDEWQRAVRGIHGPRWEVEVTPSAREETVWEAAPVYRDLGEPSYRRRPGRLTVTTRRLVFREDGRVWEVPLGDIEAVEATPPGFRVDVRGVPQPVHFFPPPGDPVLQALRRAVMSG